MYNHIKEIVADAEKTEKPISELIIEQECKLSGLSREKVWNKMKYNLEYLKTFSFIGDIKLMFKTVLSVIK